MIQRTSIQQRHSFYVRHIRGETYREIAESEHVSKECVRYWCRRQRDGGTCQSQYSRASHRVACINLIRRCATVFCAYGWNILAGAPTAY